MTNAFVAAARQALESDAPRPVYLRLAEALSAEVEASSGAGVPSARRLAAEAGINRATVTAAYRELARRGLIELRPGRPRRHPARPRSAAVVGGEPPRGALDLARYAPDRELLPGGPVFRWLGLGEGEGEQVAQYGDAAGYPPLRRLLRQRLAAAGVRAGEDGLILTSGVQHALDLLLRALTRPGDRVLVEDPSYPGLPPLLAMHRLQPAGLPVHLDGVHPAEVSGVLGGARARVAILTPTLHNPSGLVLPEARRRELLEILAAAGTTVVEEFFDPGLVAGGDVPPPLAALDPRVVLVGSFSKALFPGLRVGWMTGPREVVDRALAVKQATDLSGSAFLEAAAWNLCRRGILDEQLARLRRAATERAATVEASLAAAPAGVAWTHPRGGFSLLVRLPDGMSATRVAARAAAQNVWVLPGPAMSVTGRDDVIRVAYAAVAGEPLRRGMDSFLAALSARDGSMPLV